MQEIIETGCRKKNQEKHGGRYTVCSFFPAAFHQKHCRCSFMSNMAPALPVGKKGVRDQDVLNNMALARGLHGQKTHGSNALWVHGLALPDVVPVHTAAGLAHDSACLAFMEMILKQGSLSFFYFNPANICFWSISTLGISVVEEPRWWGGLGGGCKAVQPWGTKWKIACSPIWQNT